MSPQVQHASLFSGYRRLVVKGSPNGGRDGRFRLGVPPLIQRVGVRSPRRPVVPCTPPNAIQQPKPSALGRGRRELSLLLIQALQQHAGLDWFEVGDPLRIPAPRLVAEGDRGVIVLADLGGDNLEERPTAEGYEQAVRILARMRAESALRLASDPAPPPVCAAPPPISWPRRHGPTRR